MIITRNLSIWTLLQFPKRNAFAENDVSLERLAVTKQISWNEEKHLRQKELLRQEELKFFQENTANLGEKVILHIVDLTIFPEFQRMCKIDVGKSWTKSK